MNSNLCTWCAGPKHVGNCDREALKQTIAGLRLQIAAGAKRGDSHTIMVSSIVSMKEKEPRVNIQIGDAHGQMPASVAIGVGVNIVKVAMGAYADGFLYNFVADEILAKNGAMELKEKENVAANIMSQFRAYRDDLEKKYAADAGDMAATT
jgi:hypothetical protein